MEGGDGGASDGDEARLISFSGDAEEAVIEVEVFEAGFADFGETEAGGVEEFEDGEVSLA